MLVCVLTWFLAAYNGPALEALWLTVFCRLLFSSCIIVIVLLSSLGSLRNASIFAATFCELWALDRPTFRKIIVSAAARMVQGKVNFLQRCVCGGLAGCGRAGRRCPLQ